MPCSAYIGRGYASGGVVAQSEEQLLTPSCPCRLFQFLPPGSIGSSLRSGCILQMLWMCPWLSRSKLLWCAKSGTNSWELLQAFVAACNRNITQSFIVMSTDFPKYAKYCSSRWLRVYRIVCVVDTVISTLLDMSILDTDVHVEPTYMQQYPVNLTSCQTNVDQKRPLAD